MREFDEIFSDLFSRKNASHKEIVACLANGPKDLGQICKELKKELGGGYSRHLDDLVKAGCQIDYLIQTRFHNLYLCEIKFSRNPIS